MAPQVIGFFRMSRGKQTCIKYRLSSGRHTLAFLCALATSLCAGLAMIVRVLAALFGAFATNSCAELAKRLGEGAVTSHQRRGNGAHIGAIAVELDAARHHLYVFFAQTRRGAGLANQSTVRAGLDARLVIGIEHGMSSIGMAGNGDRGPTCDRAYQ